MRAFYQSDTDEDTCKCICGNKMKLYVPKHAPPMPPMIGGGLPPINQLQGFCSICRVQLLPTTYAYQCTAKSDKHPNGPYPYQICSRCGRHSRKHKKKRSHKYYSSHYNPYQSYHNPPAIYSNYIISPNNISHAPQRNKNKQFNRFLNTKNKQKHYEQVHQLINCASNKAITKIFKEINNFSDKEKRHLLHTIYDHFDANKKYESIGIDNEIDNMNENDIDSMAIGPSRLDNEEHKVSIMEEIQKHKVKDNKYDLIAGNVNISYENDDDFILKNAHLLEQQQLEMKRIQMEQYQKTLLNVDDIIVNELDNDSIRAINGDNDNDQQIMGLSSQENDNGNESKNNNEIIESKINGLDINMNENNHISESKNNNELDMLNVDEIINDINNDLVSDKLLLAAESVKRHIENNNNEIAVNNMDMKQDIIQSEALQLLDNMNENIEITHTDEIQITETHSNVFDTDDDIDLSGIQFNTKDNIVNKKDNNEQVDEKLDELQDMNMCMNINKYHEYNGDDISDGTDSVSVSESDNEIFGKSGDLRVAELEELFGCTIGDNLTEELGQDLWWYRVFVFLKRSELCSIFETSRYFYYMQIYHQLVRNRIINISSLPALVWKLAIFKDFKIEEKLKKSMKYLRIRFMHSMDWNAKLSLSYLQQLNLIKLPDTKQIYIEYIKLSDNTLDEPFLKMINIIFKQLFANIKSINYIELINKTDKTDPKNDFTWKLQSFNHIISSVCTKNFNRLRVPCWNQNLFCPQTYVPEFDTFTFDNTFRNIEYIYLNEMRFDNFRSLLPNDNAGVQAVNYLQQLEKLKGIILIFGEDTHKKHQEIISVSESIVNLLEMLRDTLQYMIIGVNKLEQILFNPFEGYNYDKYAKYDKYNDLYDDDVNQLPECCRLYEYNYAFKLELKQLFWTNYTQPTQQWKDEKKIDMLKQKELDAQDAIKNLIQFEIEQQVPEIQHVVNDIHIGGDNDSDSSESTSSLVRFGDHYLHSHSEEDEDDEEEEEVKEDNKVYTLEDLGNTFEYFNQQNKYKAVKGRASFIVIYNTQIYIEENGDDRVPLNTNAEGQWACPYCTMWNERLSRRCDTCRKKKTRYIPHEILLAQQQWTCKMCYTKNGNDAKNCKACTLERS